MTDARTNGSPPSTAAGNEDEKPSRADIVQTRAVWMSLAIGMAASAVYALQGKDFAEFSSILSVAVVVAGAGAFCGALLGFLFGIPRALQHEVALNPRPRPIDGSEGADAAPPSSAGYQANTNLEQISDWLTKILVGVGLTQIRSIPGAISGYANATAPALGAFDASRVFSVGLLVYYLVAGFVIGYLLTRLYLPGAFRQADLASIDTKVEKLADKLDEWEKQNQVDAKALGAARRQLEPGRDAEPMTQEQLNAAIEPASPSVKAQIFDSARTVRRDNWRNERTKSKMELTIPIFRALIAADTGDLYHRNHGQLGFALKDQRRPDLSAAKASLTEAIRLRGPSKRGEWGLYELNRALCTVNLDQSFAKNEPSADDVKAEVTADLQVAALIGRPWFEDFVKVKAPELAAWMKTNVVTIDALLPAEQPPAP